MQPVSFGIAKIMMVGSGGLAAMLTSAIRNMGKMPIFDGMGYGKPGEQLALSFFRLSDLFLVTLDGASAGRLALLGLDIGGALGLLVRAGRIRLASSFPVGCLSESLGAGFDSCRSFWRRQIGAAGFGFAGVTVASAAVTSALALGELVERFDEMASGTFFHGFTSYAQYRQ